MTRLFLAAGVAALAIAAPALAKPGGGQGKGGGQGNAAAAQQGGGEKHGRGGGGGGSEGPAFRSGGHGGGFAPPQMRAERQQSRAPRIERQQARSFERQQVRAVERQRGFERQQARAVERQRGFERQQARNIERQRGLERQQAQQQLRANRIEQGRNRVAERQALRNDRLEQIQRQATNNLVNVERAEAFRNAPTTFVENVGVRGVRGLIDGCPPGLWMKDNGCMPPGQAAKLLGTPLSAAAAIVPLSILPQPVSYFYPDTNDYYWRYGDGYLYRVDRDTALIESLLPLIGGGYVPGTYLPASYMNSYVPSYYGFNSFYPDHGDDCYRYGYGVVYEVDCFTGFVEDVIPMYAGGYGVGQMLPSAYDYYNVPLQYRSLYYNTPQYNYWYAPGAIYQVDPRSSMITSVAALLSPGFTIGQPLPMGYDAYNVPYGYRSTYYDTPTAWYRYNNGYIYQVDPTTQIVTAIVASLLT